MLSVTESKLRTHEKIFKLSKTKIISHKTSTRIYNCNIINYVVFYSQLIPAITENKTVVERGQFRALVKKYEYRVKDEERTSNL